MIQVSEYTWDSPTRQWSPWPKCRVPREKSIQMQNIDWAFKSYLIAVVLPVVSRWLPPVDWFQLVIVVSRHVNLAMSGKCREEREWVRLLTRHAPQLLKRCTDRCRRDWMASTLVWNRPWIMPGMSQRSQRLWLVSSLGDTKISASKLLGDPCYWAQTLKGILQSHKTKATFQQIFWDDRSPCAWTASRCC